MPDHLSITGDQEALQELATELQDDEDVDPRDVEYKTAEVPGQLGEPITIAILIVLAAKGAVTSASVLLGQRSARAIWNKVSRWHARHGSQAKYTIRDHDGVERSLTWDELKARYGSEFIGD